MGQAVACAHPYPCIHTSASTNMQPTDLERLSAGHGSRAASTYINTLHPRHAASLTLRLDENGQACMRRIHTHASTPRTHMCLADLEVG
jgi:hypothetical protein